MTANRRWVLASRPQGPIKDSDFRFETVEAPEPGAGEFLVKVTHLSFDPTQRGWLGGDTYLPAVKIGEVVRAGAAGVVVKSKHEGFPEGMAVQGAFGWQDYAISDGKGFWPTAPIFPGITAEQALGVFGVTGITGWIGLTKFGQPKAGETLVVSGAAGATGSVAGQVGKALGLKVIGIAGGPAKCDWVIREAGFDACIDYKAGEVARQLRHHAPKGVDIVFENVGGEILDASLANLAQRARVVLCGGISSYNAADASEIYGLKNYMSLVLNRARIEGFIVLDHAAEFGAAVQGLSQLMAAGKLKALDDMAEGLEAAPATLRRLFEGKNFGKQLLKL